VKRFNRLAAIVAAAVGIPVATLGLGAAPAQSVEITPTPELTCHRVVDVGDERGYEGQTSAWPNATPFRFTVSSTGCARAGTISFQVVHITTDQYDFLTTGGTLTFESGDASNRTATVWVHHDNSPGPDERFYLRLYNPSDSVLIDDGYGIGTIFNDDDYCIPPPDIPPGADYHCSE
jgi:hypothetical protein